MKLILSSFLLLLYMGVRAEIQLLQPQSESVQYGGQVQLSCITSGYDFASYYIAWLKQVPRNQPVYMGSILPGRSKYFTDSFKGRFNIDTDSSKNMAHLEIRDVLLEDAAVYYCAQDGYFRIQWGQTEGLIFGTGTRLYVQPTEKPTTAPKVFELKDNKEVPTIACLAKDFYPKDVEIYVNNRREENVSTVLSKEGLYSAVSVQTMKSDNFTCEVKQDQKTFTVKEFNHPPEEKKDPIVNECKKTDGTGDHSTEQINTLSFTVLGMRVLFAKTVAFNLLLSAKIFIM